MKSRLNTLLFIASLMAALTGCANRMVYPGNLSHNLADHLMPWDFPVQVTNVGTVVMTVFPESASVKTFSDVYPSVRITMNGSLHSENDSFPIDTPIRIVVDGDISISSDQQQLVLTNTFLNTVSMPELHRPVTKVIGPEIIDQIAKRAPSALNGTVVHTPSQFLLRDIGLERSGRRIILNDSMKVSADGVRFVLSDQK